MSTDTNIEKTATGNLQFVDQTNLWFGSPVVIFRERFLTTFLSPYLFFAPVILRQIFVITPISHTHVEGKQRSNKIFPQFSHYFFLPSSRTKESMAKEKRRKGGKGGIFSYEKDSFFFKKIGRGQHVISPSQLIQKVFSCNVQKGTFFTLAVRLTTAPQFS